LPLYIDFFLAGRTLLAPLLSSLPSLPPGALVDLLGIKTLSPVASKSIAPSLKASSSSKGSNLFLFLIDEALASNSGSDSQSPSGKTLSSLARAGDGVFSSRSGDRDINIILERPSSIGDFSSFSSLILKYIYICLESVLFY
jgi:hypothetical protein